VGCLYLFSTRLGQADATYLTIVLRINVTVPQINERKSVEFHPF
jgi:hypothetical protein